MYAKYKPISQCPQFEQKGFTLMDLLIAVVVISILAMVAYPSYQDQRLKTKRTEAKALLLDLANQQEAFYSEHLSYANSITDPDQLNSSAESEHSFYTATVSVLPAGCSAGSTPCRVYTLNAVANFEDSECRSLGYNQASTKTSTGTASKEFCWR